MSAYLVSVCEITDMNENLKTYAQQSAELISKYGGEYIVRGHATKVLEGPLLNNKSIIVTRFKDKNDPLRFFVGKPRTGGYGITLTGANTVIYFSNSYDLEIRLQSEDRAHRIGQTNNVTYIDMVSPDTIY